MLVVVPGFDVVPPPVLIVANANGVLRPFLDASKPILRS